MADTAIEWTDRVWNPTTGCDRISPGCDNCYALTLAKRLKGMDQAKYQNDGDPRTSGPGFALTVHPDTLDTPLRWRKPSKVFVNSMSDLFHPQVPAEFIGRVFDVMARTPQHTYQILTKRPQAMAKALGPSGCGFYAVEGPVPCPQPNVWLGTSIENDRYAFRADHLRRTPAAVRWLSLEPLLGPLPSLSLEGIDWVVVGGESGPGARPMHRSWVRDIRDRCEAAGVPFFYKQAGEWASYTDGELGAAALDQGRPEVVLTADGALLGPDDPCDIEREPSLLLRVGKKAAGRTLDGRTWDQYPEAGA